MRIANFRDDVLWAIAYKMGLDPAQEFLTDEGESLASYINAWVRRTWDDKDWPEWSETLEFTPDSNHMVAYHSVPTGAALPVVISRPLKVYLVDPRTTPYPIDTPFRESDYGLHVGFDHGLTVWIKFVPEAPKFTSIKWDPNVTYSKGDSTYSPDEGDCFTSLVNNNRANDPSIGYTQAIPTELIQAAEPPDPGHPGQNEIIQVFTVAQPDPASPIILPPPTPPPPVANTIYRLAITTRPTNGFTTLADVSYTVASGDTWDNVINNLAGLLTAAPGLAGFIITPVPTQLRIDIEDASDFAIGTWYAQQPASTVVKYQKRVQTQTFIAEVPPLPGQPQISRLTIGPSLVKPCAVYEITFHDLEGAKHSVEYESLAGDTVTQILAGLAAAIDGSTDTFFDYVAVSVDPTLGTIELSTMGGISIDATVNPESSAYWQKVFFPYALVEPVVRGAYSDALREAGQSDKGMAEEQGAVQEEADRASKAVSPAYDILTDQQRPAPRYSTRPKVIPSGR